MSSEPRDRSEPIASDLGDVRDQAAELARKTREFQVLQRASAVLSSTLDLEEIYHAALLAMDELFEFHHAIILLWQPGTDVLEVVASRGYANQATGGRVRIGTGVIGLVAERRRMLYVSNLGQQRAYAAAQRRQMVASGRGGELGDAAAVPGLPNAETQFAIPLLMRDELVGVFSIESAVRRTFTEHERTLVSIVANQIASAIHNARLLDERKRAAEALQEANATLEARVAERTAALERELRVAEALLTDARSRVEGPLLGESGVVRTLRESIARVALRSDPLLLVGPPGCGREAVAHAVHEASGRTGAFIFVSCPELHTAGRAAQGTPAAVQRVLPSKLELAIAGTLYLDAVHEIPSECRQPLLTLLESAEVAAPGTDVRIIASTTREAVDSTRARQEPLWRMLSRNQLPVPPLGERRDDIATISRYFVQQHARRIGKVISDIAPESLERLQAYPWPGNIRELRTVLERAVLVAKSSVLEIADELLDEGLAAGSYRLVSQIGSGGMGEVWLGRHRLLARPAAVKLIRHDVRNRISHERLVRRFQREAQVTSGLRSPNTVQLYDFGVNDSGSFYYVMELLNGLDLQTIVGRFGPQPASRVVMLLRQACRSLAEAHGHGLVHRDIKPANLFVTRLGSEYDYLKVLDFGIVKDQPGEEEGGDLSAPNVVHGTPAFIAPELVLGTPRLDGRADLYSLACVAYWALTGQLVFPASTATQMLLHHAQSTPAPPSQVSELPIPAELEDVLMTCLEKQPARRVASALELETVLARVPFDRAWSQSDAREWWESHAPDSVS